MFGSIVVEGVEVGVCIGGEVVVFLLLFSFG